MRKLAALLILIASPSISAEERPIPDDCEVLEGWVTVWIDQVRQAREEIINLKIDGQEPDDELSRKFEYVTYESERFSVAFEKRCNSQGASSVRSIDARLRSEEKEW